MPRCRSHGLVSFLQVVPASHNRACTPEEQSCIGAGFVTEEEAAGGGEFSGMPGGVTVRMELGDVCYFVRPKPHLPHKDRFSLAP